jgi:hypothetical protein
MSFSDKITVFTDGLKYLGWQGGTIHQVQLALAKKLGFLIEDDLIHQQVKDMLILLIFSSCGSPQ